MRREVSKYLNFVETVAKRMLSDKENDRVVSNTAKKNAATKRGCGSVFQIELLL